MSPDQNNVPHPPLLPLPDKVEWESGRVDLCALHLDLQADAACGPALRALIDFWQGEQGFTQQPDGVPVRLEVTDEATPENPEGYRLVVRRDGVCLQSRGPAGLFYGIQTLLQMIGPDQSCPCVQIMDAPRFRWRGLHLDVGRHFFSVAYIKQFIDVLARHKMNVFHWHLTEDQGWRIEIKKHPRLTEVSAWREQDGKRYGGFYSQEEVREVVEYARRRYVTVVPEIEIPGHCQAALAAYPELSCTGGPFEVPVSWGIFKEIYCAGKDAVFDFLEEVLEEVLELFPSQYIHIGGDEAPKARWKKCPDCQRRIREEGLADEDALQSYCIRRIGAFLQARGRRLIGWDEILEGGLAPGATVMSWRGLEGGIAAARAGHDVIMSPTDHCYLDYRQAPSGSEIGRKSVLPLEMVYRFEPQPPQLTPEQRKYVIGGQGNVWTEPITTEAEVDYMTWPRACALAEVLWSEGANDYEDFLVRLSGHVKRLEDLEVQFRPLD